MGASTTCLSRPRASASGADIQPTRSGGGSFYTTTLFSYRMLLRSSRLWLRSAKSSPPTSLFSASLKPLNRLTRTPALCSYLGPQLSRNYSSTRYNLSMSPVPNGTGEKYGNFDLVTRAKLDYADILVSKWKSRVTGLSVVHLDYAGMLLMLSLLCVVGDGDVNIDTKVQHPSSMDILLLVQRVSGRRHLSAVALTILSLEVFNDSGCPHTLEQCVTFCLLMKC